MIINLAFILISCEISIPYNGPDYDLFTEAVNSLIAADGTIYKQRDGVKLEVLEEDKYDRVMFSYSEYKSFNTYNILIKQNCDEDYVYYYPDINFISNSDNNFSTEEIEKLKLENDWNLDLNYNRMIKSKISKKKISPKIDENKIFDELVEKHMGENYRYRYCGYCTSDYYGRMLYTFCVVDLSTHEYFDYLIILEKDLTYTDKSFMKCVEYYNYQEELKEFKVLNNWNCETS